MKPSPSMGFRCRMSGVRQALAFSRLTPHIKLHLTNAEVGLRPVGAIGAYAPEGMWNAEGWSRFAQSFFKIIRIQFFDINSSIFDIRFFKVSFSIRLDAFQAVGAEPRTAEPANGYLERYYGVYYIC